MPTLDRHLSRITRRLCRRVGLPRVVNTMRRYYVRRYQRRPPGPVIIQDFDGDLKMEVDPATYIGSSIYWTGHHSRDELRAVAPFLREDFVAVDIGANQGEYTLFLGKRLARGVVLAFEPHPTLFGRLNRNIALNQFSRVSTFPWALGEKEERHKLYDTPSGSLEYGRNEGQPSLFPTRRDEAPAASVLVRRLDDVLREQGVGRLDLVKIDVEGGEFAVLRGARDSIARHRPLLVVELNEEAFQRADYRSRDVLDWLAQFDYECMRIGHRGRLEPLNRDAPPAFCNILCRPQ